MDRLDEEVTLGVVFIDEVLSNGHEVTGAGCERADDAHNMALFA